mmetsp:Transcript_5/g.18  ORF Transcript_5/g.18 Transcript_5/m.18 type:complete len:476 (-) Transcript_5:1885-3312(-)|eukprot:CAMPEP_0203757720 /NCGR_PEP_ID=MMETSP0098-20131031/10650_1 /ASSEMBLY_ACC=CAM_ASM_000208 /TAXON_ID=96639 /ORGANISM=" , Strain NY0313808BC1" /LENGTH=475 /DNA_ID=CAMNT_0050649949 /DNA_START=169 /DNA_END=1596 /DNA_ORIENTATION=+
MEPESSEELLRTIEKRLWLVKLLMIFLKAVAPVSLATTVYKLVSYLLGHHKYLIVHPRSKLLSILNGTMFAETLFVIYCSFVKKWGQAVYVGEPTSVETRERLFDLCLNSVSEPTDFATAWLRDHRIEDIRRGNVEDWLAWAFFGKSAHLLEKHEFAEVSLYVDKFEARCGLKLKDGHNGLVRTYKFNLESVESSHRPLVYYLCTHVLLQRVLTPVTFFMLGFGKLKGQGSFNYMVRRARSTGKTKLAPLVFIHGIGVGLMPYAMLTSKLLSVMNETRDVVVIELPAVAQQLFPSLLVADQFCSDLKKMFQAEGFDRARFVGHSYGTMCLAWICKGTPELVDSFVFLDPGCFLLHYTKLVKSIIYKDALSEAEKLFHYFLRSELFFNNHVRRNFLWDKNILFFEQIPKRCQTTVVLSGNDEIMPVAEIRAYYEKCLHPSSGEDMSHVNIVHLDDALHGGFLLNSQELSLVVKTII